MSDVFHAPPSASTGVERPRVTDYADDRGYGWLVFAGVMLLMVGVLNIVYGIAAIDNSTFYVQDARFVLLSDLNTWGWVLLVIGTIQFLAAFGIWRGGQLGRWTGVVSATVNATIQLFFIAAFPLLSLALFAVDLLVIYGLIAHGGRR